MKLALALLAAFGLALAGCIMPEEAKSPEVNACKNLDIGSGTMQAACEADPRCKWKPEMPDKPAHCKAK